MTKKKSSRPDIYTRITNQIIASLEKGTKPWTQPWNASHAAGAVSRPLRFNSDPYSGINVLTLWASAMERGYAAPIWMTFKQAIDLGGSVRKGETGSPVVYANSMLRTETDPDTGEDEDHAIPFLKAYTVFNVDQIDGLPERYYAAAGGMTNPDDRITDADAFFEATGAEIRHGGNSAYYMPSQDRVQMPDFEVFRNAESYYATLAHEMTHWTRHKSRLDRSFDCERFGDAGYAQEELVAELGAAFLCADLEITLSERDDHASYIAHWLTVLRGDNRAIFTAAAHAQRAADFLHNMHRERLGLVTVSCR